MKLSRRGKSARRGRHTKRAGKHLRYRGKKVRASKRYHRAHKRTYKRGRRFHRGGVLPPGDEPSEFSLPPPGAFYLPRPNAQELTRVVPGRFNKTLHLYYTKTSGFTSKHSVDHKDFNIVGNYFNREIRGDYPAIFRLTMTRQDDVVSFTIELTVYYTGVDEELKLTSITYIDSKGNSKVFYAPKGGCNGLLDVKSDQGPIYDFRTGSEGDMAYISNGPKFMEIVDSIKKQIKNSLDMAASTTMQEGRFVTSPYASLPDAFGPKEDEIVLPPRRV